MKRILNILLWIGITAYMLVILGLVGDKIGSVPCHSISVSVLDSVHSRFVSPHDVYTMVLRAYPGILGSPLGRIRTDEMETILEQYPFIKNAEAYKASDGTVHVRITQRTPVVRILNPDGGGYYIDSEGYTMPISPYYTARVLVANGYHLGDVEMGILLDDYRGPGQFKTAWEVYQLANYIYRHPFWSKQLEQIFVHRNREFDLVPRVGAHEILLGGFNDFENKLNNLYALYNQGFGREGWNTYKSINLKYKDQVICSKR